MQHIYLVGSEAVEDAGHNMRTAADNMLSAASQIDATIAQQRLWMEDWLARFQLACREIMQPVRKKSEGASE